MRATLGAFYGEVSNWAEKAFGSGAAKAFGLSGSTPELSSVVGAAAANNNKAKTALNNDETEVSMARSSSAGSMGCECHCCECSGPCK